VVGWTLEGSLLVVLLVVTRLLSSLSEYVLSEERLIFLLEESFSDEDYYYYTHGQQGHLCHRTETKYKWHIHNQNVMRNHVTKPLLTVVTINV
jgi:hypothetical protein